MKKLMSICVALFVLSASGAAWAKCQDLDGGFCYDKYNKCENTCDRKYDDAQDYWDCEEKCYSKYGPNYFNNATYSTKEINRVLQRAAFELK